MQLAVAPQSVFKQHGQMALQIILNGKRGHLTSQLAISEAISMVSMLITLEGTLLSHLYNYYDDKPTCPSSYTGNIGQAMA